MTEKPKKQKFSFHSHTLHPSSAPEDEVYCLQALLGRYGYLSGAYTPGKYDEVTAKAVAALQSFYHIFPDEDGVCDEDTINLLNQPRCGMEDPTPGQRSSTGRLAPFVTVGNWRENMLTFKFLNSTPDLPVDRQRDIIREAFSRWQKVCALKFNEVPENESSILNIAFHHGEHGDTSSFDDGGGPNGNTLAHAYFPPPQGGRWAGSMHFDEFEAWKDQPGGPGIRLYNVALHEIGHLLGLSHSQDTNAIMYAIYSETRNDLQADDIAGVQSLYGAPIEEPTAISPGERISGHLSQTNAEVKYQVTLQNKLLIKLDGPINTDFDLYIRHNAPVGRNSGEYDTVSYGTTSEELITVDDPKPGTYYILVHSYSGAGSYNLEVEVN